jgi:hypothetical protein
MRVCTMRIITTFCPIKCPQPSSSTSSGIHPTITSQLQREQRLSSPPRVVAEALPQRGESPCISGRSGTSPSAHIVLCHLRAACDITTPTPRGKDTTHQSAIDKVAPNIRATSPPLSIPQHLSDIPGHGTNKDCSPFTGGGPPTTKRAANGHRHRIPKSHNNCCYGDRGRR